MADPDGATPLDPDEIEGIRVRHIATRQELDELEQANIQDGLLWLARQRNPDVLSEDFIRRLHRQMFGQVWRWAGTFRRVDKNIGVDWRHIAPDLRTLLHDTRYWIEHQTYGVDEIAARFHHRLVWIHPFPNGNGRLARIATDVLMEKLLNGAAIDWTGGNYLHAIGPRRRAYIAALRAADGHDIGPLLAFIRPASI